MSRDYKPGVKSKSSKKTNPVLTGLGVGVAVSLAVAIAMMFALKRQAEPNTKPSSSPSQTDTRGVAQPDKPGPTPSLGNSSKTAEKPRFDFYTILPGLEEPISEQDIKQASSSVDSGNYFLQVGSFQATGEADNLKAKLALLGIEANIETATIPEKGLWYRVRVGPFGSINDFNKMRETLTQNGVPASPVKVHRR